LEEKNSLSKIDYLNPEGNRKCAAAKTTKKSGETAKAKKDKGDSGRYEGKTLGEKTHKLGAKGEKESKKENNWGGIKTEHDPSTNKKKQFAKRPGREIACPPTNPTSDRWAARELTFITGALRDIRRKRARCTRKKEVSLVGM